MKIKLSYKLAIAAAQDEANRRMRREGRTQWNREDWNTACDTFHKVVGEEPQYLICHSSSEVDTARKIIAATRQ